MELFATIFVLGLLVFYAGVFTADTFGGKSMAKQHFNITFHVNNPPIILGNPGPFSVQNGHAISTNLAPEGGAGGPFTATLDDPTQLPPGITVSPDGTISGTATAAGDFAVGVTIADKQG